MTITSTQNSLFRLIAASSIGTILEWYDFSLFAYLTPVIAKLFFPHQLPLVAMMEAYAIFAVGFFVRPLGAILFGHFGDRVGRQKILVWSILLMSFATFLMGLLPTYATIGLFAPFLLIILRLLQGLSAGGESTGAALFVLETASNKYRGFIGGLIWAMVGVGMLLGSFTATLVVAAPQFAWAWRVPFLFGLFAGVIGYFLRKGMSESIMFLAALRAQAVKKFPLREGLLRHKKASLIIIGLYTLSAMITYIIFIFMPSYATHVLGLPLQQTTVVSTSAFLIATLLVPMGGYLSDCFGRKRCLMWAAIGFVGLSYPLFYLMTQGGMVYFIIAQSSFLLLAIIFQGPLTATVFELIPTVVRYSVIAVCYNVSYSLFGGTAPFIATYLVSVMHYQAAPGLYLTVGALIALFAVTRLAE